MREEGRCIEGQGEYRLNEGFVGATFRKVQGGGDGVGCARVVEDVEITILPDAKGLLVTADTAPSNRHESYLGQQRFDFVLPDEGPERTIGEKAYNDDALDPRLAEEGIEMISLHRVNGRPESKTQYSRPRRATHGAEQWNERLHGFTTIGDCEFVGKDQPLCFKDFSSSYPLTCCSEWFWSRF